MSDAVADDINAKADRALDSVKSVDAADDL
jgi:hypothetical protein